jgi:hypothetical protein
LCGEVVLLSDLAILALKKKFIAGLVFFSALDGASPLVMADPGRRNFVVGVRISEGRF